MIQIKAELVAVGKADESAIADLPCALFTRDDRPLMIIGLTEEEARALAPLLFETVTIGVQP